MSDLVILAEQCKMAYMCRNSVEIAGEAKQKCSICRLSPPNSSYSAHYWRPIDYNAKHPQLAWEAKQVRSSKLRERRDARRNKDRIRQQILKDAARAEESTEKHIIKATKNSGRLNRDGDHVASNCVTLDTKLQSKKINPTVNLSELTKVREDAARSGNSIGALVIRNRNDVGVVVLHEDDFALLMRNIDEQQTGDRPGERNYKDLPSTIPGTEWNTDK